MPKVQDIEHLVGPPVVGTSYLVPTVLYPWYGKTEPWPVMGPKHTDTEHLMFPHEHYHVDVRFLTGPQARRVAKAGYRSIESVAAFSPFARAGPVRIRVQFPNG